MSPILTISQIPLQFYRERRWLQRRMLPLVCILGGLAVSSAIGTFVYAPLWVGAGLLALPTILVLLVWRTTLHRSNTVEFYDDSLLLRDYRGKIIRKVNYRDVLYAKTFELNYVGRGAKIGNVSVRCICLWLVETPRLREQDDTFLELTKWNELFLFAHDGRAETILREKVSFENK